jgi:hypothetical protein
MEFADYQKKYPNLFREHPRSGFEAGPGWEKLIDTLCSVLERDILHLPEEVMADVYCDQVKEKFGGLRFYMSQSTPHMDGAISLAESMSFHICEDCGMPGQLRIGGWYRTLCNEHAVKKK